MPGYRCTQTAASSHERCSEPSCLSQTSLFYSGVLVVAGRREEDVLEDWSKLHLLSKVSIGLRRPMNCTDCGERHQAPGLSEMSTRGSTEGVIYAYVCGEEKATQNRHQSSAHQAYQLWMRACAIWLAISPHPRDMIAIWCSGEYWRILLLLCFPMQ